MKKTIKLILILLMCSFILSGCSISAESSSVQDKNIAELEYIETLLLNMLNKYVSDEYLLEDGLQDWSQILADVQALENAVAVTVVDLASLNVNSDDISALSTGVNNSIIAIENQDEKAFLIELNNIYALIPKYLSSYNANEELIFKKQIKYYAVSTYVAYITGDIELAKSQMLEAKTRYAEKMQDMDYVENNEYNMSKVYVLIEELKSSVETESTELIRTKYLALVRRNLEIWRGNFAKTLDFCAFLY